MKKTFYFLFMMFCIALDISHGQVIVAIANGNPDNCMAPTPNAGTYTACGTVNGKNAYCKGSFLRIVWSGSRWELQGDDPMISGVTWITGWFSNDAGTSDPPCTGWTPAFGCFAIDVSGPNCVGAPPCTPPSFTSCPTNTSANTSIGTCSASVSYTATATGNPNPTYSYSFSGATTGSGSGTGSGSTFNKGTTNVTVTATNGCSPDAVCTFSITIVDNQKPTSTCPSNVTKNNDVNACGANVAYGSASFSDNCPGGSVSCSPASGSFFAKGVNTVTCTATDASGNTGTCTFTVTVNDVQKPTISGCPSNINANMDLGQCFATVSWMAPSASDNCMISTFTPNKSPGSTFTIGTSTVIYTATDNSGNTQTCSFTVTVVDNQLPSVNCPSNTSRNTTSGVCTYTVSGSEFNATATDNCSVSSLSYTLSGATTGTGTSLAGVLLNKGTNNVLWKATDVNGNMNTCSFTVLVNDVELPKLTCPNNLTVITLPGQCSISGLVIGSPSGVSDNCVMTTVSNNAPGTYPLGLTNVTWKVTDMSNNMATCNQTITVTPYSCGYPTQVYHTDTTYNSAKVKWLAGKCATSYELRIRVEITPGVWGSWSSWTTYSGPGLSHVYTGLSPSSFYNYQVRTICGLSVSASINDWFHTLPVPFTDLISSRAGNEEQVHTELSIPARLEFVPNPANDFTAVKIEGFENAPKVITMFDLYGKLVFRVRVSAKENNIELDLNRLSVHKGLYMIQVSDGEKQKTEQLVIQK